MTNEILFDTDPEVRKQITKTDWTQAGSLWEGDTFDDVALTAVSNSTYDEATDFTGVPEANQNIGYTASSKVTAHDSGVFHMYNYQANMWSQSVFDCGTAKEFNSHIDISDQVIRVTDTGFQKVNDVRNPSRWYGYINKGMFRHNVAGDTFYKEGRWVDEKAELISFGDMGCTVYLHNADTSNPGDDDVGTNAGERIVLSYWMAKDDSGLNSYYGEWHGSYKFAVAPIFENGQKGELEEISNYLDSAQNPLHMAGHTLNMQCYIPVGTVALDDTATLYNQWPGFGTEGNKRVEGICVYFKGSIDLDWYVLKEFDFKTGDEQFRWDTADASNESGYGFSGATAVMAYDAAGNDGDNRLEYFTPPSDATGVSFTLTLTSTQGWSGRAGYFLARGFMWDPIYIAIDDISTQSGTVVYMPVTNPAAGSYKIWCEWHDENYQQLKVSNVIEAVFLEGGATPPIPPG